MRQPSKRSRVCSSVRLSRRSTTTLADGGFAAELGRWQQISIDSFRRLNFWSGCKEVEHEVVICSFVVRFPVLHFQPTAVCLHDGPPAGDGQTTVVVRRPPPVGRTTPYKSAVAIKSHLRSPRCCHTCIGGQCPAKSHAAALLNASGMGKLVPPQ